MIKLRAILALITLVPIGLSCQGGTSNPAGDQIVIASDLPITGFASDTVPVKQGIELAISRQGHIGRFRLVYRSYDDTLGSVPSSAMGVQNVKRMIADSSVLAMIGPFTSNTTYEEIPVANAAHLVMLSPSSTNICVTISAPFCTAQPAALRSQGPNNYFRLAPPDSVQGRAMARFAFGTLKVRRVAAFDEWPDTGSLVIASFKDEFTRLGGSLVLQRQVAQGSQDFSAFLTDAKSKGAQALYAVTGDSNEHACAAAAQAKSAFPEGVYFFGTDAIATDEGCIKDAVDNADGIVATFPDVDITQSNEAAARSVVKSYRQAYPTTSNIGLGIYVFAAYDCARLLIDAISRALQQNSGKIPTRLQVLNAVASTQGFEGVTGTYSFDARGDATSPLMSVYRVTNGAWTYLEKIDATAVAS